MPIGAALKLTQSLAHTRDMLQDTRCADYVCSVLTEIAGTSEENQSLLRSICRIRDDLKECIRLARTPVVKEYLDAHEDDKAYIEGAVGSADSAVQTIYKSIIPATTAGTPTLHYLERRSILRNVSNLLPEVNTCHRSLSQAMQKMNLVHVASLTTNVTQISADISCNISESDFAEFLAFRRRNHRKEVRKDKGITDLREPLHKLDLASSEPTMSQPLVLCELPANEPVPGPSILTIETPTRDRTTSTNSTTTHLAEAASTARAWLEAQIDSQSDLHAVVSSTMVASDLAQLPSQRAATQITESPIRLPSRLPTVLTAGVQRKPLANYPGHTYRPYRASWQPTQDPKRRDSPAKSHSQSPTTMAQSDAHVLDFDQSSRDYRPAQADATTQIINPSHQSRVDHPTVQTSLPCPNTPPPHDKQLSTPTTTDGRPPSQTGRAYSDSLSTIRSGGSAEHTVDSGTLTENLNPPSATRRVRRHTLPQQPSVSDVRVSAMSRFDTDPSRAPSSLSSVSSMDLPEQETNRRQDLHDPYSSHSATSSTSTLTSGPSVYSTLPEVTPWERSRENGSEVQSSARGMGVESVPQGPAATDDIHAGRQAQDVEVASAARSRQFRNKRRARLRLIEELG